MYKNENFGLRFYLLFQKGFRLKDMKNENEIELYFFVRINIQEHNKN